MTKLIITQTISKPVFTGPETSTPDKWYQQLSQPYVARNLSTAAMVVALAFVPVVVPVAPTGWQGALAEPVRVASRAHLQQQPSFFDTRPESTTVDRWYAPFREPVRVKPGLSAAAQQALINSPYFVPSEVITPDKWLQALSLPVRLKPGLGAWLQSAVVIDPFALTQPEQTLVSKWFSPLRSPVRLRPALLVAEQRAFFDSPFFIASEVITVDKWFQSLSLPVRVKPGLGVAQQLSFTTDPFSLTQPETTLPSKWYQRFSEPVRVKPGLGVACQSVLAHAPYFQSPENITLDKWFQSLSLPVRVKPSLGAAQRDFTISPFGLTQPEATTPDKWLQALAIPVRVRPAYYLAPSYFAVSLVAETVTVDKWFGPWALVLRPTPQPQQQQPTQHLPALVVAHWFAPLSQPVRSPARPAAWQAAYVFAQTELVTLDKWYAHLSLPVRVRDFPTAGQQFVGRPAFVPPIAFPGAWWRPLSEPVRYRWFPAAQQSYSAAFGAVPSSRPIEITAKRWAMLSVRPWKVELDYRAFWEELAVRPWQVILKPPCSGQGADMQSYGKKVPWEERCFTMDFTRLMATDETVQSVIAVNVTVVNGVDANPAAMIMALAPVISTDGLTVGQWLKGGLNGVTYKVEYQVQTNVQEKVVGQMLLPVSTNT